MVVFVWKAIILAKPLRTDDSVTARSLYGVETREKVETGEYSKSIELMSTWTIADTTDARDLAGQHLSGDTPATARRKKTNTMQTTRRERKSLAGSTDGRC